MRQFFVFGFLFAAAYGSVLPFVPQVAMDWDRSGMVVDGRIIGGEDADISDAPWQTAMLISWNGGTYSQSCGGSIITPTVVTCAAHCSTGSLARQWRVRGDSTISLFGGQLMEVARLINHPQYDSLRTDYDISLYVLRNAFVLNGITVAAIPLPPQDFVVPDNSPSLVTGWGATSQGGSTVLNLQKVIIPTVNQEACISAYAPIPITPRMICAGNLIEGGQDACQGDSGGPLVVDGILIGITSWGRGCARPGSPGVWTRVPFFRNWIDQQISQL